jgi:KRAB domain-containing zinc finger protein
VYFFFGPVAIYGNLTKTVSVSAVPLTMSVFFSSEEDLSNQHAAEGSIATDVDVCADSQQGCIRETYINHENDSDVEETHDKGINKSFFLGVNHFECETNINEYSAKEDEKNKGEKLHECETCHKNFLNNGNLVAHTCVDTGDKPFSCEVCCKRFRLRHHLAVHTRTHTGDKPYSCQICNKEFSHSNSLVHHACPFHPVKPLSPEICNRTSTAASHTNPPNRPFRCDICEKLFTHRASLVRHTRIHTGDKRFGCEVCSKTFIERTSLIAHIRIHTGDKPFSCSICNKSFVHRKSLSDH